MNGVPNVVVVVGLIRCVSLSIEPTDFPCVSGSLLATGGYIWIPNDNFD